MRVVDIIVRKRDGHTLTRGEIEFVIAGVIGGEVPDYQLSALLMAMFLRGLAADETVWLTEAMAASGRRMDLSFLSGPKVGKHSTGGVGDKTSLVVVPIVASCGVTVLKSSGRGLGHTGGTLDKLEAIPGFDIAPRADALRAQLLELQCAFIGQTADLAPADKRLYALRDVTGTVEHVSLIASSIMSKKIAEGSEALVLDVKTGAGAFMKTIDDARALAGCMVAIGTRVGMKVEALVTSMETPLGRTVGNALEVRECLDTLKGHGPPDLKELCVTLSARMLHLGGAAASPAAAESMAREALADGRALDRFRRVVERQGGDPGAIEDPRSLPRASQIETVLADRSGYVRELRADAVGLTSLLLGAGRDRLDAAVDHAAGVVLRAKPGDPVKSGDAIAELHAGAGARVGEATARLLSGLVIGDTPPVVSPLVREVVR
jgi:pyrimidine-nucleoside phosphorylase